MLLILLVIVLVLAIGGAPQFGYHHYGYFPSGILGLVVIVLLVWLLLGRG
jgi:uncharacterized protein DUF3309